MLECPARQHYGSYILCFLDRFTRQQSLANAIQLSSGDSRGGR